MNPDQHTMQLPAVRPTPATPRFSGETPPEVARVAKCLDRYVAHHRDTALGVALTETRDRVRLFSTLPVAVVNARLQLPGTDLQLVNVVESGLSLRDAEHAMDRVCALPWNELGIISVAVGVPHQAVDVVTDYAHWPFAAPSAQAATEPAARLVGHLSDISDATGVRFTVAPGPQVHPYSG